MWNLSVSLSFLTIQTESQWGTLLTPFFFFSFSLFWFCSWGGDHVLHFIVQIPCVAFKNQSKRASSLPEANFCFHTAVFGYADMVQKFGKLPREIIVYLFFSGEQSFKEAFHWRIKISVSSSRWSTHYKIMILGAVERTTGQESGTALRIAVWPGGDHIACWAAVHCSTG